MPSEPQLLETAERLHLYDIARSRTLPGWSYTDPSLFEREKTAIFFRHWHYVCHESMLAEPGDCVTTAIHDQELFLTRDHEGAVRAFYNVCMHRGHPLVQADGRRQRLVCPYHAWTYDLTGQLIGARGSRRTEGFVRSEICLTAVRVDRLLGFFFVNLDPEAPSLADYAGTLPDRIRAAVPGVDALRPRPGSERHGGALACNWKVLIDNFLECYHCEPAHPSFSQLLDVPGTTHTLGKNYTEQHIPPARDPSGAPYPLDPERDVLDGTFWLLYPNTIFGYLPGTPNLNVSRVDALAPEHCRRFSHNCTPPDTWTEADEQRRRWAIDHVVAEDVAICEAVQRGMHSRGFGQGLYIINPDEEDCTEECLRLFHRRYAEDMGEALVRAA